MAPLDTIVDAVTGRIHDAIWSPWGAVALLGVAALLLYYSLRGQLSTVVSAAAWAVLVLTIVAGVAQYPVPGQLVLRRLDHLDHRHHPSPYRRHQRRRRSGQRPRPRRPDRRPRPVRRVAARRARLLRLGRR